MNLYKQRAFKILMGTFLVYGILVATHKGEFWPFSIYPMFSQAGNPWTRALVQDVTHVPDDQIWQTTDLNNLHGPPVVLQEIGINQIDFSDFVAKTKVWNELRRKTLIKKFPQQDSTNRRWMITKIKGQLTPDDSVVVLAIPFLLLINSDTVLTNPHLSDDVYTRP